MKQTFQEWWERGKSADYLANESSVIRRLCELSWNAATSQSANCELTNDEPAVYGECFVIRCMADGEYFKSVGSNMTWVKSLDEATLFNGKDAIQLLWQTNKHKPIAVMETYIPKKKSIDLSDVGDILTDVGEKAQSINGTSEDWSLTEPTMELRFEWGSKHDTLQQFHRYLHKEGGEWRDVPTV